MRPGRTPRSPHRLAVLAAVLGLATGAGAGVTATAAPVTADGPQVVAQYRTSSSSGTADQAEPWFRLVNTGTAPVELSRLTIRYYFTAESPGTGYRFSCSWAVRGCANVTGTFGQLTAPTATADRYLEVGFTGGAGTLAPGADSGDLQLRYHRTDWQRLTQSDDYSFNGAQTAYAPWDRVTVRYDGGLVWGTAPEGDDPGGPGEPEEPGEPGEPPARVLFDDFAYTGHTDPRLAQRGWVVRAGSGGPGVPGATWAADNITFPTSGGSTVLNLESRTDGTPAGTEQSELYTSAVKFRNGTYAARVRFSDAPRSGPDGDHVVQTFFTINDLRAPMDPDYAEYDFEYLPNGGWGEPSSILYTTSWETYRPDPWEAVNAHSEERAGFAGWHDLVVTIDGQSIRYYVDGRLFGVHGEPYLPERAMSVNVNQWFIDLAGQTGSTPRAYDQQVDYVLHAADTVLTPREVNALVADYRADGVAFQDTVPAS